MTVKAVGFQAATEEWFTATAGQPLLLPSIQLATATLRVQVSGSQHSQPSRMEKCRRGNGLQHGDASKHAQSRGDSTYFAQGRPAYWFPQLSAHNRPAGGMPGISNLFTINGTNDNDPFLGIK